jgi:hypothetical protein
MIAEQTNNEVVSCSNSETVDGSVDETTYRRHMSNAHLVIEQTLQVSAKSENIESEKDLTEDSKGSSDVEAVAEDEA